MSSSARSAQILLVTGTVLLTAALYLAPQFKSESQPANATREQFSFENSLLRAKSGLNKDEKDLVENLEATSFRQSSDLMLLDSLVHFWDRHRQPEVAAHYAEQKAMKEETEKNWNQAAYRYFDAFQAAPDSGLRAHMVSLAIASYQKVLDLNPDNLDAKTDLGLCYAEGTGNPMQGIQLLLGVVEKNPNHVNAQFNLGILSVRSGQYEKAVDRFNKVLAIDPTRKEMYFMIGKAYMMAGNKEKAIENFEKFKSNVSDVSMINETNNLINQLNNN
jgi:tetratricopeptide (TPR) repeat protein